MAKKKKLAGRRDPLSDGTHDWSLTAHYHRCPSCRKIFESREEYFQRLGLWEKDLSCPHCAQKFTISKEVSPSFGPLFGKRKV